MLTINTLTSDLIYFCSKKTKGRHDGVITWLKPLKNTPKNKTHTSSALERHSPGFLFNTLQIPMLVFGITASLDWGFLASRALLMHLQHIQPSAPLQGCEIGSVTQRTLLLWPCSRRTTKELLASASTWIKSSAAANYPWWSLPSVTISKGRVIEISYFFLICCSWGDNSK